MTGYQDWVNGASWQTSVAPQTATTAQNGTGVDTQYLEGQLLFVLAVGAIAGGTTVNATLQESDDNSTWTTIALADTVAAVTAANAVRTANVMPTKRYVRSVVTPSGGSPQAAIYSGFYGRKKYVG